MARDFFTSTQQNYLIPVFDLQNYCSKHFDIVCAHTHTHTHVCNAHTHTY